jgi:YD repeat-containing protein
VSDFGAGALLHFSYDHRDRVTWIVYTGSNGAVCYEYDPDGRITRVGRVFSGSGTVCSAADEKTDYTYDAQGRLRTIKYPNGLTGYVQYDVLGRISTTGYRRANGTLLTSDTFSYLPGGRLYASITRTTATEVYQTAYTYDAWERLLTVAESDGRKTEYEYDAFGNRTRERISNIHDPEATGGSPKPYGDYV